MNNWKFLTLLGIMLSVFLVVGCSSSKSKGQVEISGSVSYGTGPNNTKPYPQSKPVNVNGATGAKPIFETQRIGGCNKNYRVLGKNYKVWNGTTSYIEEGTASWYGPGFHGQKTSNGEIYNQKGYTAAHKNLPLPSYLLVTNLTNGKKVIVRVNDRGPFVDSRIIDLSEGSAKAIGMIGKGTAKVRIELIKVNKDGSLGNTEGSYRAASVPTVAPTPVAKTTPQTVANGWYVQLVACSSYLMASEIKRNAQTKTSHPVVILNNNNVNRVVVGPLDEHSARQLADSLKSKGFPDCFVKKM